MKCRTISYGTEGWRDKMRIVDGIIASRPCAPFIYNDVLILVPSSRMKRLYGRLFLDALQRIHQATALIQPEVRTLHQFFDQLSAQARGPRVIDENSRLVLLEGIVKQRLTNDSLFKQKPDLLAPSLSSALAATIEQLSAAGVGSQDLSLKIRDAEFSDKPQVRLLVDVYARYQNELEKQNLTDPAGRNAYLHDAFDASWVAQYRSIIIDGIHDAGKIETDILRKIAACANCVCLVEAPSSELLDRAKDFHPLRITKEFLSALTITAVQEETAAPLSDLFLATALFSDKPFKDVIQNAPTPESFKKHIHLLSAVNTREEVSLIAGGVKKAIKNGAPPESLLVAFPALDEYAPLVEEIFSDYDIPYNRALGRQLSTSPVTMALISLLRAGQEDFSGPSLLRILSSPFLKFAEQPALAPALDRLMRHQRIIGGKEKLLSALQRPLPDEAKADILLGTLTDLFTALAPFSSPENALLSVWMERLDALISWSGLYARVEAIHGPLNVNLQAFRKLRETLLSLARAGNLFPQYAYTFNEWLFLLKKTFMHTRFQVPPEDEGGVQVLGLEESAGHPWKEIYLGGLTDSKFPQRLPQNIFLPEATLEVLGIRTLERARLNAAYHFYRLLLSADEITLTWPENEGDRPVVPSPFLEELTPLRKAGLINHGIEKTSGLQFSLEIAESRSIPELAKALGLAGSSMETAALLDLPLKGISSIKSAMTARPTEQPTPGLLRHKREFWVTELDDYLNCPYDYYVKHVLKIEPLDEVTEDLSALDRGSKVHALLRNFYLSWRKPIEKENREHARVLLEKLADSAFDKEADTVRNRREKDLFLNRMAERFLDAEEAFWKQGMRPAYLEQKIEAFKLLLSNGEHVELSAKIDRIDLDENGNYIIVDYKTGKYPQPKTNLEQDIFQLPLYAVMAPTMLCGNGPALKKPIGLAYYDLAGKTGAGARDVVLYNKDATADQPAAKPKASPKSAEDFETILNQSRDKARKAVEGILAGEFAPKPRDENKCRYCPHEMMCGNKHDQ